MPLAAFQILRNYMVPRLSLRCSAIPRRPPVPPVQTHKKDRDTKVPRPIYRLDTINSSIYLFYIIINRSKTEKIIQHYEERSASADIQI